MKTPFKRVLVAVDGSPASEAGVRWALDGAGEGTTLFFCCVVDTAALSVPGDILIGSATSREDARAEARAVCDVHVGQARARGVPAQAIVVDGRTADGILASARDHAAEAIAIGSHGRSGIVRAIAGSVAEAVIRRSDVPVAVAHANDRTGAGPIAVAVDDSAAADAALTAAIALARAAGCELRLFHVFGRADFEHIDALGQDTAERVEHAAQEAAAILEDAGDRVRASGSAFEAVMLEGNPGPQLVAVLDRYGCSSIVTGTHGRSEFDRLLFGSVAAALVEHARIPVIVVRAQAP